MVFEIASVLAVPVITEEETEVGGANSLFGLFGLFASPIEIYTPAYRNQ